jgi:hypothetical protein
LVKTVINTENHLSFEAGFEYFLEIKITLNFEEAVMKPLRSNKASLNTSGQISQNYSLN